MMWNDAFSKLFYMSKSERNGVIVLIVIILLVLIVRFAVPLWFVDDDDYSKVIDQKIENQTKPDESNEVSNKIIVIPTEKQNYSEARVPASEKTISKLEYFKFDPNTATYNQLVQLGFSGKSANTLINYREKGGRFKKAADLLKLYHIDSLHYLTIEPFVSIAQSDTDEFVKEKEAVKPIMIEINSADSTTFTQLKGVGPVLASRICKYRRALGGFVSIDQISEVYNFPIETFQQIKGQLTVDTSAVARLNVNFVEISDLKRHPYCNYALARKIIDYRAKNGSFKSVDQLKSDSVLTKTELEKLYSYLVVK